MKISTRSRYGLRLMIYLALNESGSPVFLKDIAAKEEISEKYLSQIIISLKSSGLVRTFRGAHGGYLLSRPASQITLREIIESLEGDLSLVDCVTNPALCKKSSQCTARTVWDEMSFLIIDFLSSTTLEDLVNKSRSMENLQKSIYNFEI
ncbi:MAG TPA: Rrf2 family transcriptional regulator [Spirochaetota bacterium]|nr:Rrf2 family transcriptional regulator [Spirochaetota bacterium]HOQ12425.1 Rrf2 family transcriptional regulator [Spirochaetota bacterium]HOV09276.1 Rrf2 family transcriptional regulator [Spirochaetota bacterium]HPX90056.1 Rrf2 family transcriptional regulator [Spirochaetota bacterium]